MAFLYPALSSLECLSSLFRRLRVAVELRVALEALVCTRRATESGKRRKSADLGAICSKAGLNGARIRKHVGVLAMATFVQNSSFFTRSIAFLLPRVGLPFRAAYIFARSDDLEAKSVHHTAALRHWPCLLLPFHI